MSTEQYQQGKYGVGIGSIDYSGNDKAEKFTVFQACDVQCNNAIGGGPI